MFNSMLRGDLPVELNLANTRGAMRRIESYPSASAARFILASNFQRCSILNLSLDTRRPNSLRSIDVSSPTKGFLTLTVKGSIKGRPQNSASLWLEAKNFPRFR